MDQLRLLDLLSAQAAVLDAPFSELFPAVYRHSWIAYHNLVELVRKRRTEVCGEPVSTLNLSVCPVYKGNPSLCNHVLVEQVGKSEAHLKREGLSAFNVQCSPAARSCGYGCCRALPHKCRSSLDIGQSSRQISLSLYCFSSNGCFRRA